ncbi:MAG TPA: ASCH domain-containing protein [Atribacterota bacterium]|nr:ASCH domain-containing protein [Atribacterota bacterium]
MAFLLILDREHKVLWVKSKNRISDDGWMLPEVEDPVNKPSNRLNVELLSKQAFIPLKSSLIGKKLIFDIFRNEQQLYLFLCPGKESSEILFDLTKYKNIQWNPINCIEEEECFSTLTGRSIIEAYYDILLPEFDDRKNRFHIVKNGFGKKDIDEHNQMILQGSSEFFVELVEQYNLYRQPLPKIGDHTFLNNWKGLPVAVLEITGVALEPFEKIDGYIKDSENQKRDGINKTVEQYRKYFQKWSKKYNKQFSDSKSVLISQFKIIRKLNEKKMDYLDLT